MKIDIFAKPVYFNPNKNELTLRIGFCSPETLALIEQWLTDGKTSKIKFTNVSSKHSKTYEQQCLLFVFITKILNAQEIKITSDNVSAYYDYIKNAFFPARFIKFENENGFEEKPYAPSIHQLSHEEMSQVLENVKEKHTPIYFKGEPKIINWDGVGYE